MGPPSTPIKALGSGSSPAKSSTSSSTSASSSSTSPSKPSSAPKRDDKDKDDEEQLDTKSLLERMRETVEGMKQRRSLVPATPVRGGDGSGPSGLTTPVRGGPAALPRLGFGRGANPNPAEPGMAGVMEVDENEKDETGEKDENLSNNNDSDDGERRGEEKEVFSLLRPGVMEEVRARDEQLLEVPKIVLEEPAEKATSTSVVPLPVAAEDDAEIDVAPKRGTRARLHRGKKPSPSPAPHGDDNTGEESVHQNVTIFAFHCIKGN
jgi:hypothetical protein